MQTKLAIVIPAFKGDFFERTLKSVISQTNQSFNLYVGSDRGDLIIDEIVKKYSKEFKIKYKRFSTNLGLQDLTGQWNRCIALSENEEWIWLLPDDDVLDGNCVQQFYNELEGGNLTNINVCRYNTRLINEHDQLILTNPSNLRCELAREFIFDRLKGNRYSTVCEYIFRRKTYLELDKFVKLPMAWFSDDATWVKLASNENILTMEDAKVNIRQSKVNVSNQKNSYQDQKIDAAFGFLLWLKRNQSIWVRDKQDIREFYEISKKFIYFQLYAFRDQRFKWKSWCKICWKSFRIWSFSLDVFWNVLFEFNPTGINRYKLGLIKRKIGI